MSNYPSRAFTFVMDMNNFAGGIRYRTEVFLVFVPPFFKECFSHIQSKIFRSSRIKATFVFPGGKLFIKAWRLRQAHNYIKAHRKQIPLLRNCGVPQWAQKVSRLIIFLLEYFFLLLLSSSNSLEVLVCLLEQILN